jgi:hypothetical protein
VVAVVDQDIHHVKVTLKVVDRAEAEMPTLHTLVLVQWPHREANLDKVEPMDLVFRAQVLDNLHQPAGKLEVAVVLAVLEG